MKEKKQIKDYETNNEINLEEIIKEYSKYIQKIIENMSIKNLSKEDIEEITTDTFFIVWKNREKLDKEKLLSSYIAGIVKNLVKEKTRKISINYDITDYENILSDLKNIDMIYEQREQIDQIKKVVEQMKKEDIDIFNLYYYSSKKIKDISKILNISEFSVKSRLHRIRKKIKKELEKGGYSNE